MQYSDQARLKTATVVSDLPNSSPLVAFLKRIWETVNCERLCNSINRWFTDRRKKGFHSLTGSLAWNPGDFHGSYSSYWDTVANRQAVKWVSSCFHLLQSWCKQAASWGLCQNYFTATCLLLDGVNPTVWTVGYAIPYHTSQLLETLGFGLGLNSRHGWEAKHVKLAKYVKKTYNVKKSMRWWIVFRHRHEFVCLIWLREMDPYRLN